MWADANVMTAQPNIGGALCESSVIPLLVPRRKVCRGLLLECRAVTLSVYENARLGRKVNFARSKIPSGGNSPKNVYIVHQPRRRQKIVQSLVRLR